MDLEAARAERDKLLAERGENDAGAERMEELALREGEELGNLRNELLTAAQQRDEYLQAVHERDAYIGELTAYQQTLLEALEKAQQARGSESESALTSSVPPSPATEAVDVSIAKLDQQLSEAQALSQVREYVYKSNYNYILSCEILIESNGAISPGLPYTSLVMIKNNYPCHTAQLLRRHTGDQQCNTQNLTATRDLTAESFD